VRTKERWSEEKKAAAKAERDIQEAKREASEPPKKKKKDKKKKKEEEEIKIRKLSAEERISGPGNASEAEALRNTLGFVKSEEPQKTEPSFQFGFSANAAKEKAPPSSSSPSSSPSSSESDSSSSSSSSSDESDSDDSVPPQEAEQPVRATQNTATAPTTNPVQDDEVDADGFIPRRIFVGGMPFGYTEDMIREYWEYCGPIETLDMMVFPDTGRFKGIAFITFATQEAYQSALGYDGTDCDGQILKVQKCKADGKKKFKQPINRQPQEEAPQEPHLAPDSSGSVKPRNPAQKVKGYNVAYVGNIAFEASPEDIKALFESCGVTLVRLHTDKDTGKPKGYAHVHFKDEESLDKAIELDGTPLFGRRIRVGFAQMKKQQ
jgi:RNA recognition motif-containing protein